MSSCWKCNIVSENWSNSSCAIQLYLKSMLQRFSGQLQELWAKLISAKPSPEPASTEDSENFHSNFSRNHSKLYAPENWWRHLHEVLFGFWNDLWEWMWYFGKAWVNRQIFHVIFSMASGLPPFFLTAENWCKCCLIQISENSLIFLMPKITILPEKWIS